MGTTPVADVVVLHVDDKPDLLDLSARFLERERDGFRVETTTDTDAVLDRLAEEPPVDCIVSDYQMPEVDGLELLSRVQNHYPEIPFILFTGKGSEEIASEAISAGVTDYLQKGSGTDQYTVLANRIENVVAQRRAENAVETTQRRYQTLIRESTDLITVVEADGTFEFVSPAVESILGYAPDDLLGESFTDYVHPADSHLADSAFDDLVADPSARPTREFRFRSADGEYIWLEAHGRNLLADEVIGGIVVYGRDVTGRKERQRELERYERIVEIGGDGAFVLNADGEYVLVNGKTVDRTGYDRERLIGTHGSVVLDDGDLEKAREAVRSVLRDDEKDYAQFVATVHSRDGTEYPVEIRMAPIVEDGEVVGSVGTSRDFAERENREMELEYYERIVEMAGDSAQVVDADGRYVMVNDTLLERTGYEREEIVGSHVTKLMNDEDFERATEAILEVAESTADDFAEFEARVETAAGDVYTVETRAAPILRDGEFAGLVATSRDISDRKARERELERQNRRLEEFASVVSHDLRNPLNVAMARVELAREDGPDAAHLDAAGDALLRMERLIDDLRTLAREGRAVDSPDRVGLAALARESWAALATGDMRLEVDGDLTFEADRERVQQVLENLFRNAVEHGSTNPPSQAQEDTVEHSSTSPRSSSTHEDAVEHGSSSPPSESPREDASEPDRDAVTVSVGPLDEAGFYVADDGVGIDADERDRIFEANFSTSTSGSGLGLTIVEEIVDAHGWEIRLATDDESGARFEVLFDPEATGTDE